MSWGVIIVNWLTIGSAEAENNLTTLMSQRTLRADQSGGKPDPSSRFNLGLTVYQDEGPTQQEMQTRTRQASATTAEVPVFYKVASLKDEGGLLRSDGVRESWLKETERSCETMEVPQLREPERAWGESRKGGWAEGSKSWVTVNDRVVRGERSEEGLGPFRQNRLEA